MAPILPQFATAPYRYFALLVANTLAKARSLVPEADLGAPHATHPFDSTGILGLPEISADTQWDSFFGTALGQQNRQTPVASAPPSYPLS